MAKIIVHRMINHKYTQHKVDVLVKETILPFDCYIKRYDDYVVIIEAGTYVSDALLKKIAHNEHIYILSHDAKKLEEYQSANDGSIVLDDITSTEEAVKEVLKLSLLLSESASIEDKITIVYTTTASLMKSLFDDGNEKLPLDALRTCMEELVNCIDTKNKVVPVLFKIIPQTYTTHNHSTNVAFLAVVLASALDLSKEEKIDVGLAGLLHDIGKIRIDQQLLLKPSRLEDNEYETIKNHSEFGYKILLDNGITNQRILDAVHFHHEKLDGSGYPKGLRGKLISKYAKMIGLCDAFDALTAKRTFRNSYTSFEALVVMKKEMAMQFDEHYIEALINLLR